MVLRFNLHVTVSYNLFLDCNIILHGELVTNYNKFENEIIYYMERCASRAALLVWYQEFIFVCISFHNSAISLHNFLCTYFC